MLLKCWRDRLPTQLLGREGRHFLYDPLFERPMIVATVRCLLTLLSFICLFGSFGADDGNKLQSDTHLLIDSHQGLRTSSWRNSTEHTVICKRNWSPRINGYVTCCQIPAEGVIKCLPSLIIAGVQKGGTTALSALLCFIRGISFSKKKEIHYFDNVRKYSIGISEYLHYFNQWNLTDIDQAYPLAYAESTPFYLASRQACERIYKTIPDVKIVVLLREPVSRAYSEYQMKKRWAITCGERNKWVSNPTITKILVLALPLSF